MVTASVADAAPPVVAGSRELKFELRAGRVPFARRMLDALCRRDPEYPAAFVWTAYYDTPDLESLGEKIDSDYVKAKIRLRWYSELGGQPAGPAFIESKRRLGTLRDKVRVQVPYDASDLARWDLQDARLRDLPPLLRPHGILLEGDWCPLLLLRYRRDRYVHAVSGVRVCLDSDITPVAVNRRFVPTFDQRPLAFGVLEIKGFTEELPVPLQPLLRLDARKRSVSKFLSVFRQMTRAAH
jgi:hypothetical protein